MNTLTFEVTIHAPRPLVWSTMLEQDGYRAWTSAFCEGSYYVGSWDEGARIEFLAPSGCGIVAVIAARPLRKVTREVMAEWARAKAPLLLLDRVSNANNVGAIVRTAAFFGVKAIIVPDHPAQALPGEAAWRVAEGGMEFVDFYRVPSLSAICAELKRSHCLIGTSLRGHQLSPRAARARGLPRPPALILGNEERGMAPEIAAHCDRLVKIPGAETVESLNVSAAAAVLCWEFFGQH